MRNLATCMCVARRLVGSPSFQNPSASDFFFFVNINSLNTHRRTSGRQRRQAMAKERMRGGSMCSRDKQAKIGKIDEAKGER